MNIQTIQPGTALVIVGAEGAGKTQLARRIAGALGSYIEIHGATIKDIISAARNEINTVIIDEPDLECLAAGWLKNFITGGPVRMRMPYETATKEYPAPNFIFTTGDVAAEAVFGSNPRRFTVVRCGKESAHG